MNDGKTPCLHELVSKEVAPKIVNPITIKIVLLYDLAVPLEFQTFPIHKKNSLYPLNSEFLSEFLKFKANLNLYLFKDQFLI